jgi:hypothetical protein
MGFRAPTIAPALSLGLLAASGCGGESAPPVPTTASATVALGISVEEALDTPGEPILVQGWIVQRGGYLRRCTTREETEPPGCGEPSLFLAGYSGTISSIEEWTVAGTVDGTSLLVDLSETLAKSTNS